MWCVKATVAAAQTGKKKFAIPQEDETGPIVQRFSEATKDAAKFNAKSCGVDVIASPELCKDVEHQFECAKSCLASVQDAAPLFLKACLLW